jgi:hypothetical protein
MPVRAPGHREQQGNSQCRLARALLAEVLQVSLRAAATEAHLDSFERPTVAERSKVGVGDSFPASPDPGSPRADRTNGWGHGRGQGRFPPAGTQSGVPLQAERHRTRHRGD